MLRNAVRTLFDGETLTDPLFDRRAEQLTIQEFAALTRRMK
jgi:16S rRNA (adenine1518-N6/adenine1519-N6)-dimethyltransferase